ncbi:MAG: WD40 repeat domain-containing protein, partial [Cyanobacteria bacterium J06649_11]
HESSKPWIRHVSPTLNQAQAPLIRTIYGHKNTVETLAITPDGKKIVSGSWDTTIKIWDLFTGEHLKTLNGHTNIVHSVVITSDGQKIVSGASDESIKIWDVNTGEEIKTIESGSINSVTVTPDGERIISGSSDKKIRIWDVKTGSLVKIIEGHNDSVDDSVDVVSVSCDGKFIISLAGYTSVVGKGDLHHTDSYHKIGSGSATTKCAFGRSYLNMGVNVFSDTELLIDDASEKPAVKIWDSQTGFPNITLTASKSSFASALALSPDSTKVVAESGRHLKVWNLEKRGNLIKAKVSCYLQGHNRSISDVAIMPDSKYAVSGSHDLTVRVWDLENGKQIKCFTGHSGPVNAVKITPDGKIAVSASADRTIKLWNLAVPPDDKYLDKYKGHERKVTKVKLIDNGRQAISSSWDNKVLVWDVLTGQRVRKIGPFGYFLPPNEAKNYVLNVLKDKDRISSLEDEDKVPDNTHVTRLLLGDAYFDRRGSTVPPIFS